MFAHSLAFAVALALVSSSPTDKTQPPPVDPAAPPAEPEGRSAAGLAGWADTGAQGAAGRSGGDVCAACPGVARPAIKMLNYPAVPSSGDSLFYFHCNTST